MPTACGISVLGSPEWGIRHKRATRPDVAKLIRTPRWGDTAVDSDKGGSGRMAFVQCIVEIGLIRKSLH